MSNYKVIDDLVLCYKHGQESPDNSPEKESSRVAGQMLVMTFKPLILAAMSRSGIRDDQFEDAFMDGVVAFMEGLKKFDPGRAPALTPLSRGICASITENGRPDALTAPLRQTAPWTCPCLAVKG